MTHSHLANRRWELAWWSIFKLDSSWAALTRFWPSLGTPLSLLTHNLALCWWPSSQSQRSHLDQLYQIWCQMGQMAALLSTWRRGLHHKTNNLLSAHFILVQYCSVYYRLSQNIGHGWMSLVLWISGRQLGQQWWSQGPGFRHFSCWKSSV